VHLFQSRIRRNIRLAEAPSFGQSIFDYAAQSAGAEDYLALAAHYNTLVLADIPRLGPENRNEAKRFCTLIDALYEAKVNLVCSADAPPDRLYAEGDGAFEFERTASRLIEMQSEAYMATPHIVEGA